ncbi:GvpL/GvpF family gas vesicle protein [Streptomyces chartreusis]|uniref:GvpL/GvpF family gas vesicle protein n=1 Tax=Streptomyces chartreusis TaxID=1969 RepID=UPI0036D95275
MSIYVYGIAQAANPSLPEKADGIGDPPRPVRILREGDLAAIVSDAPEDLRPKRSDLLAHQHVLAQAGNSGLVLPMRFGSLAPDDTAVTAALAERAAHYLQRLQDLAGTAEYSALAALLEVQQQALGADHPDTLTTRNNLAVVRVQRGDLEGAEADCRAVLADRTRTLGADHRDSGDSQRALDVLSRDVGDRRHALSGP